MVDDAASQQEGSSGDNTSSQTVGPKRERSLIEFAYTDLQRAVDLASHISRIGGYSTVERPTLAVAMDQSATGGTFRSRLGAASLFGLVKSEHGKVQLTELGIRILDDQSVAAAKSEAFLNVPLYKALLDKYQGYPLPPIAAIERHMHELGVPVKQTERARQAFFQSATYAGFIADNGRFSKPPLASSNSGSREDDKSDLSDHRSNGGEGGRDGGSDDNGGGKPSSDALLSQLLNKFPEFDPSWPDELKAKWFEGFEQFMKKSSGG